MTILTWSWCVIICHVEDQQVCPVFLQPTVQSHHVMDSISGTKSDMETVLMPGFRIVKKIILILRMEWNHEDTWGLEVLEILQELNITIGVFLDKEEQKSKFQLRRTGTF